MIVIVDYDTGNTRSISQAFETIGLSTIVSDDPKIILEADGLVLPGVGAFPKAMDVLENKKLIDPIKQAVASGIPILGICLGMQLLFDTSYEHGKTKGFGFIPGKVVPFPEMEQLLIPHMGWNQLDITQTNSLFFDIDKEYAYYVHSYYVECSEKFIIAISDYGITVPGIVQRNNVFGMQFHPEKSGEAGQKLLQQFKKVVNAYDRISSY